jgi:hypothetical protein
MKQRVVDGIDGYRIMWQIDTRSAIVAAKRIGLRRPVQMAARSREPVEIVLGRLVVVQRDHVDGARFAPPARGEAAALL